MPISSLIKEEVTKTLKERDDKKKELEKLISTHIKQMWRLDLEKIEKTWDYMLDVNREEIKQDKLITKRRHERTYFSEENIYPTRCQKCRLKKIIKKKKTLIKVKSKKKQKLNLMENKNFLEKKIDGQQNKILIRSNISHLGQNDSSKMTMFENERKSKFGGNSFFN